MFKAYIIDDAQPYRGCWTGAKTLEEPRSHISTITKIRYGRAATRNKGNDGPTYHYITTADYVCYCRGKQRPKREAYKDALSAICSLQYHENNSDLVMGLRMSNSLPCMLHRIALVEE